MLINCHKTRRLAVYENVDIALGNHESYYGETSFKFRLRNMFYFLFVNGQIFMLEVKSFAKFTYNFLHMT